MFKSFLSLSYKNLKRRKLRSWITVLGIVISIATILTMVIVSESLEVAIKDQFEKIGSNRLFVMVPGGEARSRVGLTTKDLDTLEGMNEFDYVIPYLYEPALEVEFSRETAFAPVVGWPTDDMAKYMDDYDITLREGRSLRRGEKFSAVLGIVVADDMFRKEIALKSSIYINGTKFRVVGILNDMGNPQDNQQVIVPLDVLRDITNKKR